MSSPVHWRQGNLWVEHIGKLLYTWEGLVIHSYQMADCFGVQTSFLNALLSSRLKPRAALSNSSQTLSRIRHQIAQNTALMQCALSKAWQKMHIVQGIAGTVLDQHNSSPKWGQMMTWMNEHAVAWACLRVQCLPMLVRCALLANRLWAETFRKSVDTGT